MLTKEELQYLIWVVAHTYTGSGAIVDLGPWLGSSTAALAEGLRASGVRARAVHAYDLFEWRTDYMSRYVAERMPEGADFRPLMQRNTAEHSDLIRAARMDLLSPVWNDGPIEILFVDAAKSWGLLRSILNAFGPNLVPGRSRVILQDFRFFHTYWLPLVFDSRPDLWQECEAVTSGTTNSFRLLKAFDGPTGAHADYGPDSFSLLSAERLLRHRAATAPESDRSLYRFLLYRIASVHADERMMETIRSELITGSSSEASEQIEAILALARSHTGDERVATAWEALARQDIRAAANAVAPGWMNHRADVLPVKGRIAQLTGDLDAAMRLFDAALTQDESSPNHASMYLAECHLARSNFSQCAARVLFQLEATASPSREILHWAANLLEACWTQEQDRAAARTGAARLLELFPECPDLRFLSALVARGCGEHDLAREQVEAALRLDPRHARALSLLGELCGKK